MGFEVYGPIVMAVDNTAAIDIAQDVGVTKRNKHFERALHYIRREVSMLRAKLFYVPTDQPDMSVILLILLILSVPFS
jgi:hypothetical protein